ncbi:MAG: hypothetical protein ACPGR2_05045 [Psychrobium sp.]
MLIIALYLALVAIIKAGTVIIITTIVIEDCSDNTKAKLRAKYNVKPNANLAMKFFCKSDWAFDSD